MAEDAASGCFDYVLSRAFLRTSLSMTIRITSAAEAEVFLVSTAGLKACSTPVLLVGMVVLRASPPLAAPIFPRWPFSPVWAPTVRESGISEYMKVAIARGHSAPVVCLYESAQAHSHLPGGSKPGCPAATSLWTASTDQPSSGDCARWTTRFRF